MSLYLAVLVLAGCKTTVAAPPTVAQPAAVESRVAEPELTGFDQGGAATCLPLAEGRTCLSRQDLLATACGDLGGDTLVCEDCAVLCTKPVSSQ